MSGVSILGFSGRRGSGKTTAAEYIRSKLKVPYGSEPVIFGFFDTAKEWYRRGMGLPKWIDWSSQEVKDSILPNGKTHRQGLVSFGTACRDLNPDWWVSVWASIVDELDDGLILVPDVRYPNELKAIQDRGGHVIRNRRAPHPEDLDETERSLDGVELETRLRYCEVHGAMLLSSLGHIMVPHSVKNGECFDALIDNRFETISWMQNTVLSLVQERKWV